MITSEIALLDTNILVYAADTTAEHYDASRELRGRGIRGELPLAVSPQVLMEFFAVITNPRRVQQSRSPEEARAEIEKYVRSPIRKIHPGADIMDRVLTLLEQHPNVSRQDIFDLFLAATMLTNDVTRIYSYNQNHFNRFSELEVLTP